MTEQKERCVAWEDCSAQDCPWFGPHFRTGLKPSSDCYPGKCRVVGRWVYCVPVEPETQQPLDLDAIEHRVLWCDEDARECFSSLVDEIKRLRRYLAISEENRQIMKDRGDYWRAKARKRAEMLRSVRVKRDDACAERDEARAELERVRASHADYHTQLIQQLRELCADYGDNDWPDDLDARDVIEKHLARHLWRRGNPRQLRKAYNDLVDELAEVIGERDQARQRLAVIDAELQDAIHRKQITGLKRTATLAELYLKAELADAQRTISEMINLDPDDDE